LKEGSTIVLSSGDEFTVFEFLGHEHYRCNKCGECFCGNDVGWVYHDCLEEEEKEEEETSIW
jgi:hypothetical protein